MCEVLTDNRNRTAAELRKIFETRGGSLGATGCVSWMFTKKGLFTVKTADIDEETIMEIALEAGADDIQTNNDAYEITCSVETFEPLKAVLKEKAVTTQVAEISQVPSSYAVLDEAGARKIINLMEAIEDQDDVQNVSANFDIPDEVMKAIESD